ncbi:MAG: alginate export family protein [Candidatus Hydrogenedentota bacterium]
MSGKVWLLGFCVFLLAAAPALAELQQVEVGGSVRIRGDYINNEFVSPLGSVEVRWGRPFVAGRPIGGPFNPDVASIYDWDNRGNDLAIVEQRTRLHLKADFTDDVSSFIEFDSYDYWGEDFRSNYVTGVDSRANSFDDVEVFQAYIDAKNVFDTPIELRVGRQELNYGSGWLVGPRDNAFLFYGLSFDALRLRYAVDTFAVDAFWAKVAERFSDFGDDDIDFYGVYGSYTGLEQWTFDAYWFLLRDDTPITTFLGGMPNPPGAVRDAGGYDETHLHTLGLRAAGLVSAFDIDAEVAYQFGDADHIGSTFRPYGIGDDNAEFDSFALKLDAGYTFDVKYRPRLFVGFRYYDGEDNRDISRRDFFRRRSPQASISFNRLFSNDIATGFIDSNNDLSNAWYGRLGVMGHPTDKTWLMLAATYYETVDPFDRPNNRNIFGRLVPGRPYVTTTNDTELGWELTLFGTYQYSEDLIFEAGWTHLFVGDGLRQGHFSSWNGMVFNGGSDDDGADYAYLGCKIFF